MSIGISFLGHLNNYIAKAWWYISVILTLVRLRKEAGKSSPALGYCSKCQSRLDCIMRSCFKNNKTKTPNPSEKKTRQKLPTVYIRSFGGLETWLNG